MGGKCQMANHKSQMLSLLLSLGNYFCVANTAELSSAVWQVTKLSFETVSFATVRETI